MESKITLIPFLISLFVISQCQSQILFDVQEEQQAPVLLGNIATKANISSIPNLDFSLLSRKDLFQLDPSTGDFSTRVVLDREKLCGSVPHCVLTCSVAVSSAPSFFQRYTVNITIVDANDQRPDFGYASFPRSLSEGAAINTTIQMPTASDLDYEPMFKVQDYYLEPQSPTTFDLVVQKNNKSDGTVQFDIYLRLVRKLDRETKDSYSLVLVASDGEGPNRETKLRLIITVTDENDNEPVFEKKEYKQSVKEITAIGTTVLTISASDDDDGENGRVGYEFPNNIDRKVLEYFEINSENGGLKLVKSLEKEGGVNFKFQVKAQDHGTPLMSSVVDVVVTVEDTVNDPPSISISHWKSKGNNALVSEDAVVGTKVAFVDVKDTDSGNNGETSCTATSDYFNMQTYNNAGEYTVSVAANLDREKLSGHIIVIICVDQGSPPLTSTAELSVVVEDVNDHRPLFTKGVYNMKVKENQESGESVGNVYATDADEGVNAILRYSLEPDVVQFEINESNGFIYTAIKNLDRETTPFYTFKVYAFDTGLSPLTATATVTVEIEDLNDMWPRFENSSYKFYISERAEIDTVVGHVHASDPDLGLGGVVEYLFVHSPLHPELPFSLSQTDGTITLTSTIDYETTSSFNFVVTAFDLGKPPRNSSVEVHIDVLDENDNSPVITFPGPDNLSVTLNLNVAAGHEVVKVIAHDQDIGENGRLSYSLGYPNNTAASKLFWINEDTGLVTLISPLTPADVRSYNIVISVNDNGKEQRATQALLQVEVVQEAQKKNGKESYTTIVIIMVCVTLFVAVIVLVTLCFIKYIDKKKFDPVKEDHKPAFDPEPAFKTAETYIHDGGGDETLERGLVVSPSLQKQAPPYQHQHTGSQTRNGKKSVTFDNEIRSSDTSCMSDSLSTPPDSGFSNMGSSSNPNSVQHYNITPSISSFHPSPSSSYNTNSSINLLPARAVSPHVANGPSVPLFYNTNSQRAAGSSTGSYNNLDKGIPRTSNDRLLEEVGEGDELVDVALQKHNALVRSMRGNSRRPPYASRQARPASGGHETDLCSSSSVETSDSGHGGSELDVSVIKVNV